MERPDVDCAVTEEYDRDAIAAFVLFSKGQSGSNRDLRSDDSPTAHEAVLDVVEVHRATATFRAACFFAEQLGHASPCRSAAGEVVAVAAVGRHHVIIFLQH